MHHSHTRQPAHTTQTFLSFAVTSQIFSDFLLLSDWPVIALQLKYTARGARKSIHKKGQYLTKIESKPDGCSYDHKSQIMGWWCGVVAKRCVRPTKLLYASRG